LAFITTQKLTAEGKSTYAEAVGSDIEYYLGKRCIASKKRTVRRVVHPVDLKMTGIDGAPRHFDNGSGGGKCNNTGIIGFGLRRQGKRMELGGANTLSIIVCNMAELQ
jgi:hypothetical protein